MKEIKPEELTDNPFSLIGNDWMLITAEKDSRVNMMTASWGQLGIMWNKPVVNIFIRESRFTKTFIDSNETFTLCILPEEYRDALKICGSKTGRDTDKVQATGLTVKHDGSLPYFAESRLVLECRKLYSQPMPESAFSVKDIYKTVYPTNDLHTQYICEITRILTK